jgi:subtilisin family serine protease
MKNSILISGVMAAILCFFPISVPLASDAGLAVVSFDYKSGKFSDQFIDWVARFGARNTVITPAGADIEALVTDTCGESSKQNVALFSKVLGAERELVEGQLVEVPPCLPNPQIANVPRLALPNETFWSYYQQAKSGIDDALFIERPISTFSSSNPPAVDGFAIGNAIAEQQTAVPVERSQPLQAMIETAWGNVSSKDETYGADLGRIAFDAARISQSLETEGIQAPLQDVLSVGKTQKVFDDGVDVASIKFAADAATKRWNSEDFRSALMLADRFAAEKQGAGTDYLADVAWFEPSADAGETRNPKSLQPGDVVVAPSAIREQYIQIPIDKTRLAMAIADGEVADGTDVPAVLDDAGAPLPVVSDLATFHVGEVTGYQCSGTAQDSWGSFGFLRRFREAALKTRMNATRRDMRDFTTTVLIADAGFIEARQRMPFGALLAMGGNQLSRESPSTELPPIYRTHGNAVAGLAIGGPDLWPLALSLGIDLKLAPAKIFIPTKRTDGQILPFLKTGELERVFRIKADVYNISFGSTDVNLMERFRNDFIEDANDKLFVVAAGNNNLNNTDRGVDVGDASIYPQIWGGNETGKNMLLVASLDGDALATFSNWSKTKISVAAPGCGVTSWKPDAEGSVNQETAVIGTSFSAPIVSYVAALVKALSPLDYAPPAWVRARIIASADLTEIDKVEHGRVLNPIKAISIYEDVIEHVGGGEYIQGGFSHRLA